MIIETKNRVTARQFRANLDKYITAARKGGAAIGITKNSQLVGIYLGAEDYEALFGAAIKNLLSSRSKGATIPHEEVRAHIRKQLQRLRKKS